MADTEQNLPPLCCASVVPTRHRTAARCAWYPSQGQVPNTRQWWTSGGHHRYSRNPSRILGRCTGSKLDYPLNIVFPTAEVTADASEPTTPDYAALLTAVLKAWDKLPGGKHYSSSDVQTWLVEDLGPAVAQARATLSENGLLEKKSQQKT